MIKQISHAEKMNLKQLYQYKIFMLIIIYVIKLT